MTDDDGEISDKGRNKKKNGITLSFPTYYKKERVLEGLAKKWKQPNASALVRFAIERLEASTPDDDTLLLSQASKSGIVGIYNDGFVGANFDLVSPETIYLYSRNLRLFLDIDRHQSRLRNRIPTQRTTFVTTSVNAYPDPTVLECMDRLIPAFKMPSKQYEFFVHDIPDLDFLLFTDDGYWIVFRMLPAVMFQFARPTEMLGGPVTSIMASVEMAEGSPYLGEWEKRLASVTR
jgi:hypothetical protein